MDKAKNPTVIKSLYVYDSNGHHVRIEGDGHLFYASVVFSGRAYSFSADMDGAALLKKALSALLDDAGA